MANPNENTPAPTTGSKKSTQEFLTSEVVEARLQSLEENVTSAVEQVEPIISAQAQRSNRIQERLDALSDKQAADNASLNARVDTLEQQLDQAAEFMSGRAKDALDKLESLDAASEEAAERGKIGFHPKTWGNLFTSVRVRRTEDGLFEAKREADAVKVGIAGGVAYGGYRGIRGVVGWVKSRNDHDIVIDDGGEDMFS